MDASSLERRLRVRIKGAVHRFAAVVPPGFERAAMAELEACGISDFDAPAKGLVFWQGKIESFWTAHAIARLPASIRWQVAEFGATGFAELRRKCERVEWELFLPEGAPVRLSVASDSSRLWHEGAIAEEIERALASRGHAVGDEGTSLFARMERDRCALWLEGDPEPLYRRGLDKRVAEAPLRDNLAWGLLLESGIGSVSRLCDPMCGSGSFSLEAFLASSGAHPAKTRRFDFERWPSTRERAWEHLRAHLPERHPLAPENPRIDCSDLDPDAVATALSNFAATGLPGAPEPRVEQFFDLKPEAAEGRSLLVLNPPWGKRIAERDLRKLYAEIGRKIAADFRSWDWTVLAPGLEAEKALGLRWERKLLFRSGGIGLGALFGRA